MSVAYSQKNPLEYFTVPNMAANLHVRMGSIRHPLQERVTYCGESYAPHMVRATWLFRCALVCRDFAEPALSALYHSPPLHPAWKAHALIRRLKDDPQSSFKCCNKVQYLTICDPLTFGRKHIKHDPISLADIITYCPQLRGLLVSRSAAVPYGSRIGFRNGVKMVRAPLGIIIC